MQRSINLNSTAITLTQLLQGVGLAIRKQFSSKYWVTAEVININYHHSGNIYLELGDTDERGQRSKARAVIWSKNTTIINKFQNETGVRFDQNINVMIQVEVTFKPQYGLTLNLVAINSEHTIGKFELKLRAIRQRLKDIGEEELNRQLVTPQDFTQVAVISPANAAGLGDFRSKSDILQRHGLCKFTYFVATFEGGDTTESIVKAFTEIQRSEQAYDAICLIRGGGDKAGLNDLCESAIARAICRVKFPVFTGIGHERDVSLLDEYSNKSFGTPSLVIGHIENQIVQNAFTAKQSYAQLKEVSERLCVQQRGKLSANLQAVMLNKDAALTWWRTRVEQLSNDVLTSSMNLAHKQKNDLNQFKYSLTHGSTQIISAERLTVSQCYQAVSNGAYKQLQDSRYQTSVNYQHLKSNSRCLITQAIQDSQAFYQTVNSRTRRLIADERQKLSLKASDIRLTAKSMTETYRQDVSNQFKQVKLHSLTHLRQQKYEINNVKIALLQSSSKVVESSQKEVIYHFSLVNAHDPQKILDHGYAVVMGHDGKVIKTTEKLKTYSDFNIRFSDGVIPVSPSDVNQKELDYEQ